MNRPVLNCRVDQTHWWRLAILFVLLSGGAVLYYAGEILDSVGLSSLNIPLFRSIHDWQRMVFLAPIAYGSYYFRLRGAVATAAAAFLIFLPRALWISPYPYPLLRMILFIVPTAGLAVLLAATCNLRERKTHQAAIAKSEKDSLLDILNGMDDGVCIIGADLKIRFANARMVLDFGPGIGRYCYTYLRGLPQPCPTGCRMARVLKGSTCRLEYRTDNGKYFEVTASPFRDLDGRVCQLSTVRDITLRKHMELDTLGLDKGRAEVVSHLSHELKSPLTGMKGIISTLLQPDVNFDSETRSSLLKGLLEETGRMESLVTNLLNMGRLESRVWKPVMEPGRIEDAIHETTARLRVADRGHIYTIDIEPGLPEVCIDREQICLVLGNLLDNASAYSSEGTEINVSARRCLEGVEVVVTDRGQGMPPEDLDKAFKKYFRGAQQRNRGSGTGLGLSICRIIVNKHGGRVWAESEAGRGSAFHFTLKGFQVKPQ